jgi:hypothetical protein
MGAHFLEMSSTQLIELNTAQPKQCCSNKILLQPQLNPEQICMAINLIDNEKGR